MRTIYVIAVWMVFVSCQPSRPTESGGQEDVTVEPAPLETSGTIVAQETFTPGTAIVVEAPSPSARLQVVFEDDGDTGYFYALDFANEGNPIVDALHIYNVANVEDRHLSSVAQIVWSKDGLKACLLINDYPHAVFDFETKRGYCRTGFPPADPKWTSYSHDWDDAALEHFR